MISRVFVVEPYNKRGINLSRLYEYGEIVYLFPVEGDRTSIFDPTFEGDVIEKLETYRFDPATDFIAIVGPMVSVCLMIASTIQYYAPIKVLAYDRRDDAYTTITLGEEHEPASTESLRKD
jgi:hypothetical protein